MKTVIECKTGHTIQTLGGVSYSFDRDEYGRFVNDVSSVLHRSLFLNVSLYQEVPLTLEPEDDAEIPAFLTGQTEGTEGTEGTEDAAATQQPVKPIPAPKKTTSKIPTKA